VSIPFSKLKAGDNVITLVMASTQAWVNHLMYDYISLEAAIPDPPCWLVDKLR
jgi:protein-L-isoaspartate O-methyltransferase